MTDETDLYARVSPSARAQAIRTFNAAMDKLRAYVHTLTELSEKEQHALLRAPILEGPVGGVPAAFYEEAMRREQRGNR